MPQMMPINWISLFFFFIMIYMIFLIMNYYNYNMMPMKTVKINFFTKKNNHWKW